MAESITVAAWETCQWCYLHSVDTFPERGEYEELTIEIPANCQDVEEFIENTVSLWNIPFEPKGLKK